MRNVGEYMAWYTWDFTLTKYLNLLHYPDFPLKFVRISRLEYLADETLLRLQVFTLVRVTILALPYLIQYTVFPEIPVTKNRATLRP